MILHTKDDPGETRDGWQTVVLRGGPHDRQTMVIPVDQDSITCWDGPDQHVYTRFNNRPLLFHESRIARMLGGGR
ncbi:MAG: hypothetical protein WD042_03040 [Phycisphaeraceae bacterium]